MVGGDCMSKQDRQGVRTAQDLERKYDFSQLGKGGNRDLQISQLMQSLAQLEVSVKALRKSVENILGETYKKNEIDTMFEDIRKLLPVYSSVAILDEAILDEAILA